MNSKVLLTTVFSGYNFGSSLQALAGKTILKELGYECEVVAQKSLVKGRDIRLGKLFTILTRSLLLRGKSGSKALSTYQGSYNKTMIGDSAERFARFTAEVLQPRYLSWSSLKKEATDCVACFAGSDQIWHSSTMYVDPMYYLRFAPAEKRVAFAPSFGRDFVAAYNKTKMSKWIGEFAHLSVREDSGVTLIKEMTGKEAVQLIDPTLMVDGETWKRTLGIADRTENYILAYFLDKPSDKARNAILELKDALHCEVIGIPYQFNDMGYCDKVVPTGPIEFLDLINNAKCVLTDSFHGTAFSIIFKKNFYSIMDKRTPNTRITSLLSTLGISDRACGFNEIKVLPDIDYTKVDYILNEKRQEAMSFLETSLK